MLLRLRVEVQFGQVKVDHVHHAVPRATPHDEVFRLDVAVEIASLVDAFHSIDQLTGQHQHRLQAETTSPLTLQILQALSEKAYR